jgi:uncharacterized membrane protein
MLQEFTQAAAFYLVFSLFGVLGFALLIRFQSKNLMKFLIVKPLGLIVFAFPVWLLASLKIIKFNNNALLMSLFSLTLLGSIASIYFYFKNPKNKKYKKVFLNKRFLKYFIISEIVSLVLYFGYLYIRGFSAQLEGTEKFMDLLLYMSAGKTDYFPFVDPWQAGLPVNYYYYGFYLFTLLNRIARVPYASGYNFSLGIIFICTVILSFGIVYKLTKSKLFSLFGAGLVSVAGNIHYAACVYKNFRTDELSTKCFYPAATRILDPAYTINEMPSYSFILGDMHPHVMAIPFFLMNLYLLILMFTTRKVNTVLYAVFGLGLATSFMINTWDFIILAFLFAVLFIYRMFFREKHIKPKDFLHLNFYKSLYFKHQKFIMFSFYFALSPIIFFLPFLLHFKSPVEGVGFAPEFVRLNKLAGQDYQYPSSLWFHFGLWGGYLILSLLSILVLVLKKKKFNEYFIPLFMVAASIFFIAFMELFYFKDLFHIANPPYFRANTAFKLGYLSWILWSIATAVLVQYVWKALRSIKSASLGVTADFIVIVLIQLYAITVFIYPYYSIKQAYAPARPWNLKEKTWTLDGSNYMKTREADDYATVQWINKNFTERKIITEAVGGSYTYYARISVNTGMINPINWPSHEWTWRFHYPDNIKSWKEALGQSIDTGYNAIHVVEEDVKKIYESENPDETKDLINKYKIDYIFIGNLERTTYTALQEEKFNTLGEVVFSSGESKLYKVNR